jgi:syntaxin 7
MTTRVASFRKRVDAIGSRSDTPDSRARLHAERERIASLAKTASDAVKRLASSSNSSEAAQAQHAKLARDLYSVLNDFQRAQRSCDERERMYSPQREPRERAQPTRASPGVELSDSSHQSQHASRASAPESSQSSEHEQHQALLDKQRKQREKDVEAELEYNTAIIDERDRGISDIQSQISEVHDIFQDLASLTSAQGAQIDDLETNISSAHASTRAAQGELTQADKQHRSSRRRNLCLLLAAVVLASSVVAIVVGAASR